MSALEGKTYSNLHDHSPEHTRASAGTQEDDRRILDDIEEVEGLLTGHHTTRGLGSPQRNKDGDMGQERQRRRDAQRPKRKSRRQDTLEDESGGLLFEMEEGVNRSSTESLGDSSDVDRQRLQDVQHSVQRRKPRLSRIAGIHIMILAAFLAILYGASRASHGQKRPPSTAPLTLTNGTTLFAPTTILISLDGFRADFLHRGLTPNMNALIQDGVSPPYMLPSFPSVTFPNHFTLVTGLYPESHGVVGNTFWDPHLHAEFYYTDPARSMQPKWWNAEPLWETLEYAGVRTAVHMWPGSEAHIGTIEPAYIDLYKGDELLSRKVDRILGLLDLPGPDDPSADVDSPRPQMIAAYVPNVDADGHKFGPNSTQIQKTIQSADAMIGDLISGLENRNLSNIVNIVIVSDHGMATTSVDRLIDIESIIDMDKIEHTDGWPSYGLRPKNYADLEELYNTLATVSRVSNSFEVYLKDKNMPERYHFSKNDRIAPLWVVPTTGWAIVRKHELADAQKEGVYHPQGIHGYDHEHPLMRAIFIARGPAFPHSPGSRLEIFQNIEVYNIVCDSVGVEPKVNNGTLRLPLKPMGLHDTMPPGEIPDDPAPTSAEKPALGGMATSAITPLSNPIKPMGSSRSSQPAESPSAAVPSRPVIHDEADKGSGNMWWEWAKGKLDGAKGWAADLLDGIGNNNKVS